MTTWTTPAAITPPTTLPSLPTVVTDFRDEALAWEATARANGDVVRVDTANPSSADYEYIDAALTDLASVCSPSRPFVISVAPGIHWPRNASDRDLMKHVTITATDHPGGFCIVGEGTGANPTRIILPYSYFRSGDLGANGSAIYPASVDNARIFLRNLHLGDASLWTGYPDPYYGTLTPTASEAPWTRPFGTAHQVAHPGQYFDPNFDVNWDDWESSASSEACLHVYVNSAYSTSAAMYLKQCTLFTQYDLCRAGGYYDSTTACAILDQCRIYGNTHLDGTAESAWPYSTQTDGCGVASGQTNVYYYVLDSTFTADAHASFSWNPRTDTRGTSNTWVERCVFVLDSFWHGQTGVRAMFHAGGTSPRIGSWIVVRNSYIAHTGRINRAYEAASAFVNVPSSARDDEGGKHPVPGSLIAIGAPSFVGADVDPTMAGITVYFTRNNVSTDLSGLAYIPVGANGANVWPLVMTGYDSVADTSFDQSNYSLYMWGNHIDVHADNPADMALYTPLLDLQHGVNVVMR